ncbi:hypothetical protein [Parapedobacter tibetensis]|uniref:hypothetical protein n=1 Tax=Parapedobacter tibetensis TaxID=2972951 RepID=UPI00214D3F0B|nr:hypothetical protein [Parapedobacter tibetensis]
MYTLSFPIERPARHVPRYRFPRLFIATLVALLLFMQAGDLLRFMDSTAAAVDIGVLSLILLALLATLGFIAVSRWLLGLLWPVLRDYQKYHFESNFKSLQPWQKITFYLVIFFGLLYAFVCCLVAVF